MIGQVSRRWAWPSPPQHGHMLTHQATQQPRLPLPPPPPPLPPPPPPLPGRLGDPVAAQTKRRGRSFLWKTIPEEQVRGRANLWNQAAGRSYQMDVNTIHQLFGQKDCQSTFSRGGATRGSFREPKEEVSILNSKRGMNVGIFLKQFKRSNQTIIEDIRHGNSGVFGAEPLRELLKLLPETEEVKRLRSYKGDVSKLSLADSFLYLLVQIPSYSVRIEAMLLKEEFPPTSETMKQHIKILQSATRELLVCQELHTVLHLVLQAGNLLNTGSATGHVLGFQLSSLLSLSETKGNTPGINLVHFVAQEAQKKDEKLLTFPEKLKHVQAAARISVETLDADIVSLRSRTRSVEETMQRDSDIQEQLESFLQSATVTLRAVQSSRLDLQQETSELMEFFCEDKDTFKLDNVFNVFHDFCNKFNTAVKDNLERQVKEAARRRRLQELEEQKRHSWAGGEKVGGVFGMRCSSETDVDAALSRRSEGGPLLELLTPKPRPHSPLGRSRSLRRSRHSPSGSPLSPAPECHLAAVVLGIEAWPSPAHARRTAGGGARVASSSAEPQSGLRRPVSPPPILNQQPSQAEALSHALPDLHDLHVLPDLHDLPDLPGEQSETPPRDSVAVDTREPATRVRAFRPALCPICGAGSHGDGHRGRRRDEPATADSEEEATGDSRSSPLCSSCLGDAPGDGQYSRRRKEEEEEEEVVVRCVTGVCDVAPEAQLAGERRASAPVDNPPVSADGTSPPVPLAPQWSAEPPSSHGTPVPKADASDVASLPTHPKRAAPASTNDEESSQNPPTDAANRKKADRHNATKHPRVRTLTGSEVQGLRRVVPLPRPGPVATERPRGLHRPPAFSRAPAVMILARPVTPASAPSSRRSSLPRQDPGESKDPRVPAVRGSARGPRPPPVRRPPPSVRTPAARPPPEEKMCRSTLRALAQAGRAEGGGERGAGGGSSSHHVRPPPSSTLPGFARNTASSSFRRTAAPPPSVNPQTPSGHAPGTAPGHTPFVRTSPRVSNPLPSAPLRRSDSIRAPTHDSSAPPKGHKRNNGTRFSDKSAESRESRKSAQPQWR